MTSKEIRSSFLAYFEKHGHRIVASSPLVPHEDPTLLFTNAGMNQFKDVLLGKERRSYTRATTVQKCMIVRAAILSSSAYTCATASRSCSTKR